MKVDKQHQNVCYNDSTHTYWNENDNGKYISVTTLIGKFCQEFDKDFWSGYKALERILSKEAFTMEKKQLLSTHKIDIQYFKDMYNFTTLEYNREQQAILDEWEETNRKSCERGTEIHAELENNYLKRSKCDLKKFGLGGKFDCNPNHYELDLEKGVYPEYLVYRESEDKKFRLAGQIDLLIKDGNDIYIVDYKGLPLDTPIATPQGWKLMKDLEVGDYVYDKEGLVTKVLNVSEVHSNPCHKINFDNSESIICDHEHRWEISFRRATGKYITKVMTTEELIVFMNSHDRTSYNIPRILNPKPIQMEDADLPIDPYILGAWLGDGSKSCGIITNVDPNFWEEVTKRGYTYGENLNEDKAEMRTIYNIRGKLNDLGLLNNKFIPDIYLRASYQQRLDLLRGLMDTDGYYHIKRKRFVMNTDQEWQAKDLVKLVASLGWKPTVFEVINKCNGKEFQGWNVCFFATENPFLIRNQEILLAQEKDNASYRVIESVEQVETVPTRCIEVDSPSHTYLAGYSMIPTHNTNKKLEDKSFFDSRTRKNAMMKYPMSNLMDCNMMHYTLQLSTYAWMLQKFNPDFVIKKLLLIHYDHKGNVTEHEVEYLKEDVEKMCMFFKKQHILEDLKSKRKPIEF